MAHKKRGGPAGPTRPTKVCVGCGRTMTWRKAWARSWDEVRYCSDACRSRGVRDVDRALEAAILARLSTGPRGHTIDPSDAARDVAGDHAGVNDPAELAEPARSAARRLAADGQVDMLQAGRPVDPSTARGPVRLRLIDHS